MILLKRLATLTLSALFVSGLLAGCSATSPEGACGVRLASDYDDACIADSDCVAAPLGGNTCSPCESPQEFWCKVSVVNAKTAATYLAEVAAALNQMERVNESGGFCAASCPVELGTVGCVEGRCGWVAR
jgi:hypothetical protein